MRTLNETGRHALRVQLEARAAELREQLAQVLQKREGEAGALPRHDEETDDDAVADLEASLDAAAASRESRELQDVERALARLDSPDFGLCEDCGVAIPRERLHAAPAATRCIACQSRHERAHGFRGAATL